MKAVLVNTRFWSKVNKTKTCWNWIAGKTSKGYGDFWLNRKHKLAHRFSYEMIVGNIPEGLVLDHACRNPACVRPSHLEPVTHRNNILRGIGITAINSQKMFCPRGHLYDMKYSTGRRGCKACNRDKTRKFRLKKEMQNVK